MSQLSRRIQFPLFGMLLLGLLAGVYLTACKRFTRKSISSQTITRHTVKKPASDVLKYWTAGRMQSTKGMALPEIHVPGQEQRPPHKSSLQQN